MSLRVLLREQPSRALAVLTDSHALIFRHILSSNGADVRSNNETSTRCSDYKCMVEFTAHNEVDLGDYHVLRASGVHGTLGLININADVFLCVISGAIRVATGQCTLAEFAFRTSAQIPELYDKFAEQETFGDPLELFRYSSLP